jgi:hypothetical protein
MTDDNPTSAAGAAGALGTSTWASRNPLKDVQPSRVRIKIKITDAEKATRNIKRQLNKSNALALRADVDMFCVDRDTRILEMSKKYSKKPSYIRALLTQVSHYKKSRAPSLRNALVHHKTLEINESMLFNLFLYSESLSLQIANLVNACKCVRFRSS